MKVTVVTSSRADWASTGMVVKALGADPAFEVSLYAGAASGEALNALMDAVKQDGAAVKQFITRSMDLTADDPVNVSHAAAQALGMAGEVYHALSPDLVVLPGDRFEIVPCAISAALAAIPIAHLAGGDVTLGSQDNQYRDAISGLAKLHFTTNGTAQGRLLNRFGKNARNVFWTGSPSIDRLKQTVLPSFHEMSVPNMPDWCPQSYVIVNWQPETAADWPNEGLSAIIEALMALNVERVLFIGANPDVGYINADKIVRTQSAGYPGWVVKQSLPPRTYLALLKHARCLVGNSSSGIYEAPYLGTPVINVGDRQKGRAELVDEYIINVRGDPKEIKPALDCVINVGLRKTTPPVVFGEGDACTKIVRAIKETFGLSTEGDKVYAGAIV